MMVEEFGFSLKKYFKLIDNRGLIWIIFGGRMLYSRDQVIVVDCRHRKDDFQLVDLD